MTRRPSLPGGDVDRPRFSSAAADAEPVVRTIQSTSCMPERSTVSSMKPVPVGETSVRNASEVRDGRNSMPLTTPEPSDR